MTKSEEFVRNNYEKDYTFSYRERVALEAIVNRFLEYGLSLEQIKISLDDIFEVFEI